jgi:hypothetical protein
MTSYLKNGFGFWKQSPLSKCNAVTELNMEDQPLDKAIRLSLKQFQEIGSVTATPQMLENTWREIEYRSDILRATKCMHIEVV